MTDEERSQARLDFRQKAAAKRVYREQQSRPVAIAWRFAVDLFDVLWHQQTTARGKAILAVAALAAATTPFILIVVVFNALFGGSK